MMTVWNKKIEKAEKFFDRAKEHGRNVYNRYKDDRQDQVIGLHRVNIFYSNVNTIKESLFNSLPKPDVSRVHKGDFEDDVSRVAANILQRALNYEVQCLRNFEPAIKYAILDRLVPGMGQVWLRFEQPEAIAIDVLYWEDFIYQPARNWDLVQWVARKHELTKDEFIEAYGEEGFKEASQIKADNNVTPKELTEDKYCAYEIWDKKKKEVVHIVKGAKEPLKTIPDPYGLPDFYPCPPPMFANLTTSALLPITDYHLAQDQYNELDTLYARMALITRAVKVAGAYDASATEISRMLEGQENKLIPVDNWAMYAEKGGAKGLIDWYPIEQIVTVYQALQQQYDFVKSTLFEITGMSDIMRGASNQYETASAQEIKAQFASVRMGGYQRGVNYFVRDILNVMACLMCKLYSDEKFQQIVGSFTEGDQQYLAPAMQLLRDNVTRQYKVDIESDSLTQSDWALEKNQRMELTGYIGQFLTAALPAVQEQPQIAGLLMGMLKFTIAGFKGASELEGIIDSQIAAMEQAKQEEEQNPQPPEPSPEEQQMQAEMQMEQQRMQMEQQKMQAEAQMKQMESQQKLELERAQAEADLAVTQQKAQLDMQLKREEQAMKMQMLQVELAFKKEEQRMKLEGLMVSSQIKTQQQQQQMDIKEKEYERRESREDAKEGKEPAGDDD
jgi:hypothetical protein